MGLLRVLENPQKCVLRSRINIDFSDIDFER